MKSASNNEPFWFSFSEVVITWYVFLQGRRIDKLQAQAQFVSSKSPASMSHRRLNIVDKSGAFSLIELLVVMAIIILMVALAANLIVNDQGRSAVSSAISAIEGTVSQARMEARGRSTYTWVCLQPLPSNQGLAIQSFATKDGSTNVSTANLVALSPYKILKNVGLAELSMSTPDRLAGDYGKVAIQASDLARLQGSTSIIQAQAGRSFSNSIIRFSPRGVPVIPGASSSKPFVEVLVYPLYGGAATSEKSSSVLVQASTGIAKKYW